MTIAEKLRKEMEERGAVKAVPQKTVIVNTSKQKKAAEKSAPSLLSQGQRVDIVRDAGAKTILPGAKNAMEALLEQQRKSRSIRNEMNAISRELRKSGATDFASYQAAAQKQMELYKEEKINPLSGCLPMLLTIPIFFEKTALILATALHKLT